MYTNKSVAVLAVIIGILALWPQILGDVASKWVIVVSAVLLLIGALKGYCCDSCGVPMRGAPAKMAPRRRKRR